MTFANPQAFVILLFILPLAGHILYNCSRIHKILRITLIILFVFALADPSVDLTEPGTDVIVIADRSSSMGSAGEKTLTELSSLLTASKGKYDRLAMISFGSNAVVEKSLDRFSDADAGPRGINPDGSSLTEALRLASQLSSGSRRTRLLVISDGFYTGKSPEGRDLLASLDSEVWFRHCSTILDNDAAAGEISLPGEVTERQGFIIRYSVYSKVSTTADITLSRGTHKLAEGKIKLSGGWNTFFARDIADTPGMLEYILKVDAHGDKKPENDISKGLVRVISPPGILHISAFQEKGLLAESLTAANIPVNSVLPGSDTLNAAKLAPYRVVILENTSLEKLGRENAANLSNAVNRGIVSLMVTGGRNSFGNGGYHKSPLDELLPVTMKLREEQKRAVLGLVIAVDRSGSMAMTVPGGQSKMHLANSAAAECISLLSPADQVSYIAVDSSSHTIVPLSRADNTKSLINAVMRVESMGGGIFVHTALQAALKEIKKSKLPTRHIILFSDAADSEEQQGCINLVSKFSADRISLSVIGLGRRSDPDASFLINLAKTAGGEIFFTENAHELPRIFSSEVIRVARRGFIEESTGSKIMPDMLTLGIPLNAESPSVNGYNLTSPRKGSLVMLKTTDEYKAPLIALKRFGRSASAAITAEVDVKEGSFSSWQHTPEVIVSTARQLAGEFLDAEGKATSRSERGYAAVELELSRENARQARGGKLFLTLLKPDGSDPEEIAMQWQDARTAAARFRLDTPGHYLPVIDLGAKGIIKAPALTLPYSSEFMPVRSLNGREVLTKLADTTGGSELSDANEIFELKEGAKSYALTSLQTILIVLCMILLLIEIAEKRLRVSDFIYSKKQ
ncbi:MAG: VWA domain-containing protein [Planctomycetota bacterium]|jgi:Mg-chelatase subunit ChlD